MEHNAFFEFLSSLEKIRLLNSDAVIEMVSSSEIRLQRTIPSPDLRPWRGGIEGEDCCA